MTHRRQSHSSNTRGFTLSETLTALVALIVLGAVAVTMWRVHDLRSRRGEAIEALLALQAAQDQYFGTHARYANAAQLTPEPPAGLGIKSTSPRGYFDISIRNSDDDLGYWAIARAVAREGQAADTRCVELRLDQNGRRFAVDADGADKSADCWR